jgi:hypothetical protein
MTRLRIAPLLLAALLFTVVVHNHPVAQASSPCSVCVHHESADLPVAAAIIVDEVWSSAVPGCVMAIADAETVTAATRGPPQA